MDRTALGKSRRASFAKAVNLTASADVEYLGDCTIRILTVPTPIDGSKRADFTPLRWASGTVGDLLKLGDTAIYESTAFPGATEKICVPILESVSGLGLNEDFTVGYCPQRINPGESERRLPDIVKVTSGSVPEAAERIDALYSAIITTGDLLGG